MYYIIRIILFVVLLLACFYTERTFFKKQIAKGKQYTMRKARTISITFRLSFLLLQCLIFHIPFEAPFLHFGSVEDALKYKWINPKDVVIHSEDDCAFAVKGSYEIFAFDKDDKGYGFVNYHADKQKYYASDMSPDNKAIVYLSAVYQKTAEKTFYLLGLETNEYQDDLLDCDRLDFDYLSKAKSNTVFIDQVYAVKDGKPEQDIHIQYGDQQKTFTTKLGLYITVSKSS